MRKLSVGGGKMPRANAKYSRLNADIMSQVLETKALAQKTDRRVKDILVLFQTVLKSQKSRAPSEEESIQTSEFRLSQVYSEKEMENLLQSSDSVLSLRLGDLEVNSVGVIWEPEPESTLPLRRVVSEFQSDSALDCEGFYKSRSRPLPLPSELSSTSSLEQLVVDLQVARECNSKGLKAESRIAVRLEVRCELFKAVAD